MEYLVICDLAFKEVTSMLNCYGTNTVMVKNATAYSRPRINTINEPPGETFTT